MAGIRVGEAATPGPAGALGDPASTFAGSRPGFVFTTRNGATGYYEDKPGEPSGQVRDPGLSYLALARPAPGTPTWVSLQALLPGAGDEDCWQPGQRRRERQPRHRKRPRRFRPAEPWEGTAAMGKADASFRKAGLVAIDTVNPNASPAAVEYLKVSAVDAVVVQELRTVGPKTLAVQRNARAAGWALSSGDAATTEAGGVSAGVGVAVRSCIGLVVPPVQLDSGIATRFHLRWAGMLAKGGLHVGSLYLRDGEGASQANLDLLQRVAGVLKRVRGQWVLGGDFNMTPQCLDETGWLGLVGGVIHKPRVPTCNGKVYDYFVASRGLSEAVVDVTLVSDVGLHPHSPARLLLRRTAKELLVRTLAAPVKIPATLPAGCKPDVAEAAAACQAQVRGRLAEGDVDAALGIWYAAVEEEAADMIGLEGKSRGRLAVRSQGPRFVLRPALGLPGSADLKASEVTTAWRVMSGWMLDVLRACGSTAKGLQDRAAMARWELCFHQWTFKRSSKHTGAFLQWAGQVAVADLVDRRAVVHLRATAAAIAKVAAEYDDRQAHAAWMSWVREGPAQGLRRQHLVSRVKGGWTPSAVGAAGEPEDARPENPDPDEPEEPPGVDVLEDNDGIVVGGAMCEPLSSQAAVEVEADFWAGEWLARQDLAPLAWPSESTGRLAELAVEGLREAARTFAEPTGLGWDKLHPRALLR